MNQLLLADLRRQAEELLRTKIAAQPAGTRLTTERELADELGLGRTALRAVLNKLEDEGLLVRRQGSGTYIADRKDSAGKANGFSYEFSRRGLTFKSKVLSMSLVPCPEISGLPLNDEIVELRRIRILGNEPVTLETSWLPDPRAKRLFDFDLASGSLYGFLEKIGLKPYGATEQLRAINISAEDAMPLGVKTGEPGFEVHRRSWDVAGSLVELVRSVLRADRFEFVSRIESDGHALGLASFLSIGNLQD